MLPSRISAVSCLDDAEDSSSGYSSSVDGGVRSDSSNEEDEGETVVESGPLVYGADDIMSPKEHGTSSAPVQETLRYGVSGSLADKICSFNRVFAEMGGYFDGSTSFEKDVRQIVASMGGPITFYDSMTGKPLFKVCVPPASSMCCCR